MEQNTYLPKGLPFIPDQMLRLTAREYRKLYRDLARTARPTGGASRSELREALKAIDEELRARGIGDAPWWTRADKRNEA